MAIPDLERIQQELSQRFPDPWVREHLATLPDAYFRAFDLAEIAVHLALLLEVDDNRPLVVRARPAGTGEWWVDAVGLDAFQLLATVCNAFAVRGLSIIEGRVFTSRPASVERPEMGSARRRPPGRTDVVKPGTSSWRTRIIDTFRVRRIDGEADSPDWNELQTELITLAKLLRESRTDEVFHRTIGRFVAALDRYHVTYEVDEPIEIELNPSASPHATLVRIAARDSLGFLSVMAGALALCGIRIQEAEIRTGDGRVDDALWITDRPGRPITDATRLRELKLSLILIEHFSARLPRAADPEAALLHFSRFALETMARPNWSSEFAALDRPDVLDRLIRVLGDSHFLWEDYLHTRPATFLPMICNPAEWQRRTSQPELAAELESELNSAGTAEELLRTLREFKDRGIFRADVRAILEIGGSLDGFSAELSDLAEVLLRAAFARIAQLARKDPPHRASGGLVSATLCALGKFGGRELGFASDLELMLVYDDRDLPPATEATRAGDYFDACVSALRTAPGGRQGRAFDLDFRLRPYGRAGAPATSWSVFRDYYRAGGPAWSYERQALIKLRAFAGDPDFSREVEALRDRFVYGPEPFDLESFQRLRHRQVEQLVTRGTTNAKYSPGALVDIEYFTQALQIHFGASEPRVRATNTLQALRALEECARLPHDQAQALCDAYQFFRVLIDALRVAHGAAKDLTIPKPGSEEFGILVRRMRRGNSADLVEELHQRLDVVQRIVEQLPTLLPQSDS
jgi:glutamate-ammonia-ligase adenylyltransferase